jgi:hypothetical protein
MENIKTKHFSKYSVDGNVVIRFPWSNDPKEETKMVTNKRLKIRSGVKAGALTNNHNQRLKIRSGVKAGALNTNHNQSLVRGH